MAFRNELAAAHHMNEALLRELEDVKTELARARSEEPSAGVEPQNDPLYSPFEEAAFEGRRRRERAQNRSLTRAQKKQARAARKKQRKENRAARSRGRALRKRRRESTAPLGWLSNPWTAYGSAFVAAEAAMPLLLFGATEWLAPLAAVPIALYALGRGAASLGPEAEQKWVDQLPFPLIGHWRVIDTPRLDSVNLTLQFSERAPDVDLVRDMLAAAAPNPLAFDVQATGSVLTIDCKDLGDRWYWHSNRAYVRFLHRLMDDVVIPLHNVYPVASVSVTS